MQVKHFALAPHPVAERRVAVHACPHYHVDAVQNVHAAAARTTLIHVALRSRHPGGGLLCGFGALIVEQTVTCGK